MFRPHTTSIGKIPTINNSTASNNNTKQLTANNNENFPTNNATTTIREIRSRTIGSTINNNARNLLVNRRQAMSMERLNSSGSTTTTGATSNDKNEKNSPSSGSTNSINGSTTSSPQRAGGGLNRTASRVSRFRSAKAVFERLSNNNNNNTTTNNKLDKPIAPEKPRGTVASRYAAAAAARATNHANNNIMLNSPRSRAAAISSLARSHDSGKSTSNIEINRVSNIPHTTNQHQSPKSELHQPKPQPRIISTRISSTLSTNTSSNLNEKSKIISSTKTNAQSKPPPQDLIDKIVLEIASDAIKQKPDPDCTIQDLSNCDITGIPETLDFDRCFQDVEMMTEEEARKLLSKKHDSPPSTETKLLSQTQDIVDNKTIDIKEIEKITPTTPINNNPDNNNITASDDLSTTICSNISNTSSSASIKSKVRFSEEPVQIYATHGVEDYDRRNKDIDPVAASAEYELEKSKERDGICDDDNEDEDDDNNNNNNNYDNNNKPQSKMENSNNGAVKTTDQFIITHQDNINQNCGSKINNFDNNPHGILILRAPDVAVVPQIGDSYDLLENKDGNKNSNKRKVNDNEQKEEEEEEKEVNKEYIESLERELSLKRILEQNLRDLQSQYYEAVKELDDFKSSSKIKFSELENNLSDLNCKLESTQNELVDSNELKNQFEKQLNDIKESSQILEKKYHRAKRIIKDMQSRELSFNRREQLYQQKLDEIEYELGVLIESIFKTIHDDNIKFNNLIYINNSDNQQQQQAKVQLDDFGLIKQILTNFNINQSTQNPQIKQRVLSILEQQMSNLIELSSSSSLNDTTRKNFSNNNTSSGIVTSTSLSTSISAAAKNLSGDINNAHNKLNLIGDGNKHSQNINNNQFASHRLSQPNLPHPIGVGGQPTKLFHGIINNNNPIMMQQQPPQQQASNEPSPPQSVNSYPSTNSLNSLNNNNNHLTTNNNNNNTILFPSKHQQKQPLNDNQLNTNNNLITTGSINSNVISTTSSSMIDEKFQPVPDIQVPYQTNEWHDKPVCEWTTTQVSTWLLALGLDQYISKFEDRNVNGQSLINLDSTVLKGLGVLNSNDRNLLKKKIRELRNEMEKERKLIEKKIKENLKDKSKNKQSNYGNNNGGNRNHDNNNKTEQSNKSSWKRGLLS